ncbi:MAG TPA: cytochrome b/b6 domain-containing protein [Bacteroidales bacterium]|nr:cytochrome B [Bacteroidales bacterium]HNR42590.1 cytochrome b/b6 domain-containing protein [Bacteroidales bacterium]HPM18696.1 cytochrome b/b6 domain-containing protein [Bacteroidales bacterium]HQG77325.1 cytochrome b/b6 domain-containing protein [Bacteroidales bacterium]
MSHKMYLYPKWVRGWHVLNAVLFLVLIVTGLSMQYSGKDSIFIIGFANAVKWHNFAAIVLTINYIVFVTGNLTTRNGRYYRISKQNFWSDLLIQLKYYSMGMFKGEKHPFPVTEQSKFNPLQKFTYVLAMYLALPLLIISGFGLLFPEITIKRFAGVSGLILTDILHITMGFLLSVFMVIHIYTCTLGTKPWSLFKGIITGYHESDEL